MLHGVKFRMKIVLSFLIIFISGCSSLGGSRGSPYNGLSDFKPETGQVYIYRPSHFVMGLAIPTLKIDGKPAMSIRDGSYMVYDLSPGNHKFVLKENANWAVPKFEFDITIKKNERKYFRLSTDYGSITFYGSAVTSAVNGYLGQVSEEFAMNELKNILHTGNWP